MDSQSRMKEARKALNLTQEKFAESLGIPKRTYISYEQGDRPITERLIISICAVHGVNEKWLRTGEGEMFPKPDTDPLWGMLGEVLKEEKSSFRRQLITALCQLEPDEIAMCEKIFEKFLAEREKAKKEEEG